MVPARVKLSEGQLPLPLKPLQVLLLPRLVTPNTENMVLYL